MKGWTSSSKQQETPPEPKNTKDEICLEQMKRKVKITSLEWDDFVLQEQLNSWMYVNCSLLGDTKKENFIDELNFENCIRLKIKTTSKLYVGITWINKSLLLIQIILMP